MVDQTTNDPKDTADFQFLLALVQTGSFTPNYKAAAAKLGLSSKQVPDKTHRFRKKHDWPLIKESKSGSKRVGEEKEKGKPVAKRAKNKQAKEKVQRKESDEGNNDKSPKYNCGLANGHFNTDTPN